jgi:hypothetical protein
MLVSSGVTSLTNLVSVIDAAAWQPWSRFAIALLAAVVQQPLCTTDELDHAMQYVGRVRHKAHLREAIRDIRGGSQALSEIDLIRVCRRFGIQEPDRQVTRFDSHGRLRYLDAEWELRATAIEMRVEPALVVADLCAIGVPRVVSVGGRQSNHRR